jgi:imidazolonepropionase-like amidohydrolase
MKIYILITFALFFSVSAHAQVPSPAGTQKDPILLKGGTIHVGNGTIIENGLLTFNEGILTFVGTNSEFKNDGKVYREIELNGKHVYPGLIMMNSILGLNEINSIKVTRDFAELGSFTPNVRSIVAYNTDSERIPNNRSNGILLAQIVPVGGTVSGSSSVVQLDAWNWEDAVVKSDEGVHFFWPNKYTGPNRFLGETEPKPNENYTKTIQEIEKNLIDAKAYSEQSNHVPLNFKLEALAGLFSGSSTAYIHVNKAAEIIKSIQLLQKCQVEKIVLVGATDAHYVADFIRKYDIPVILGSTHNLPSRQDEDVDNPYKLPSLLVKEGITVAIGAYNNDNMSNLPFSAGTAATYGLSKEEALKLLTFNAAKILGIDDELGSLETGKRATIVVSDGDLLDMSGNNVQLAFIDGREIDLDNKQKKLYRKFKAKYE